MVDHIKQQLAAAKASEPPDKGKTPPAPSEGNQGQGNPIHAKGKQAPALRPAFRIASYTGFDGKRFVAHGLTQAQADTLTAAALAAGIPQQH